MLKQNRTQLIGVCEKKNYLCGMKKILICVVWSAVMSVSGTLILWKKIWFDSHFSFLA